MSGKRTVIDPVRARLVSSLMDKADKADNIAPKEPSLDNILKTQMSGLSQLTDHLVAEIKAGIIGKDTPAQLATCIKVTMDLKAKEKELLDDLSDEELDDLAKV